MGGILNILLWYVLTGPCYSSSITEICNGPDPILQKLWREALKYFEIVSLLCRLFPESSRKDLPYFHLFVFPGFKILLVSWCCPHKFGDKVIKQACPQAIASMSIWNSLARKLLVLERQASHLSSANSKLQVFLQPRGAENVPLQIIFKSPWQGDCFASRDPASKNRQHFSQWPHHRNSTPRGSNFEIFLWRTKNSI